MSAAFAYLLTCLKAWGFNSVYIGVVLIWIIFFPMNPLMGAASTKDTLFAALFLLAVCELTKIIRGGGVYTGASALTVFVSHLFVAGCVCCEIMEYMF